MYLKEIVASGFKSFADKLNIKLDDKITCIVGPNGSGKSNVVDAVRWVLGEQSVKSLRGDGSMSDVIFSGSKSRNPLNVASVELIFDNNDHYLNIPYTDISIKRKVYRSGENEYYLNGEKCRLKDILNLLLDTGVGKESFNIISQGEVDKILSNSPMDRRVIFEEAAGILKYKKRKEEALRKLDRTHNNLDRVNDIIAELELQVEPLKEQSKKAKEYVDAKEKLTNLEVALIAHDLEFLNEELEKNKSKKERLDQEILSLSNETTSSDAKVIENQNKLEQKEKELETVNQTLLQLTEEVEKINGEKNLLKERNQQSEDENKIADKVRNLLEEKGQVIKNVELLKINQDTISNNINELESKLNNLKASFDKCGNEKNMEQLEYSRIDREIITINHKIDSLNLEIENGGTVPNSVKEVLKSTELSGIYDTIGNVVNIDEEYIKALDIALSSSKNFVITKDESSSIEAVHYLKDNKLGRATFFPLTVIKERYIDGITLNNIKTDSDFIGVLADLVKFDSKYKNIIYNQLGTVLVSPTIEAANRLSKVIDNRYKIVTLDGDVIHVGGSISGGSTYKSKSVVALKYEVNHLENKLKTYQEELEEKKQKISILNEKQEKLNEEYISLSRQRVIEKEKLTNNSNDLDINNKKIETIENELTSYKSLQDNTFSSLEEELINKYNEKVMAKEKLLLSSKNLAKEIESLKDEIEKQQANDKLKNANLRNLEKEIKDIEIFITRSEVKMDSMLDTLNEEYSLTYEKAKSDYTLEIDAEEARSKVNSYKSIIRKLGMVNLAAIEEYERVNTRYEFLTSQREDLLKAEDTLLDIMNEMDGVMIEEFSKTFEKIRTEFKQVFKELFGGGSADLTLTNPDDLLSTGIEIVASPPGKKLTTISLLSGGEKTFTAISLLFAILNVKTVPFCLFDEVEAALDEANVEAFGKYLNHYKDKTQFLIITHKKKTMEFADTLYGITMQESGVSKLVSVKLKDQIDYL
ncbi:MAG: AAA family ATPase [Bacilli bacterium]|nr:AAA family ATPase [Bacilli bacterium]